MFRYSAMRPAGHTFVTDPDGLTVQSDTLQCVHCGRHWTVVKGSGIARGYCTNCGGPTCGRQGCETECRHFEAKLEDIERAAARLE